MTDHRPAPTDRCRAQPARRARDRGDPRHPRDHRRARAAGAAVQRRQGLGRHAAPRGQGVLAGPDPVPGAARRHRPQLPRGARLPRRHGRAARAAPRGRSRAGLHRRRPAARAGRRHPQPAADPAAARRHHRRTASTPSSAAAAATRRRPAPRSASSPCATSSASGTHATSAPSCGTSTTPRHRAGRARARLPAVSNWTELDVWRYIEREDIELPEPLLRARARGVRARRHAARRRPGARSPARRRDRRAPRRCATAPSATCRAPARSRATPAPSTDVIAEVAAIDADRARRHPRRRPDLRGRHGGPQEGGLLLMSRSHRSTCTLLRLATAGSVDDGKSTLVGRLLHDSKSVLADQLDAVERVSRDRGLALGRPRAAHRRPARRARAGHHHRRRLPLLRHGAALVHARRLPRPRAVHPQHRDRRVHRRRARAARRRPQGRARADPPPPRRRGAAARAARRRRRQQDRPRRATARTSSAGRRRRARDRGRSSASPTPTRSRSRRSSATTSSTAPADTPWYDGPAPARAARDPAAADTDPVHESFRLPGAARHPPPGRRPLAERSRVPRVRRPARLGLVRVGDEVVVAALRLAHAPSPASTSAERSLDVAFAPQSVTIRLADDIDISRGDLIAAAERPGAAAPGGHRPRLLARRRRRCAPAPGCSSSTGRARCWPWCARSTAGSTSTPCRLAPTDRLALNDIGRVTVRFASPLPVEEYSTSRRGGAFLLIDARRRSHPRRRHGAMPSAPGEHPR